MTKITVGDELLYRQIHPDFFVDGKLGSPAFKPSPSDKGKMSADRSTLIDAASAHAHYTEQQKRKSACVCGVTVGEFEADAIVCHSDPIAAAGTVAANPAHCLADYTALEEKKWKNVAKKLRNLAEKRGICFQPHFVSSSSKSQP